MHFVVYTDNYMERIETKSVALSTWKMIESFLVTGKLWKIKEKETTLKMGKYIIELWPSNSWDSVHCQLILANLVQYENFGSKC